MRHYLLTFSITIALTVLSCHLYGQRTNPLYRDDFTDSLAISIVFPDSLMKRGVRMTGFGSFYWRHDDGTKVELTMAPSQPTIVDEKSYKEIVALPNGVKAYIYGNDGKYIFARCTDTKSEISFNLACSNADIRKKYSSLYMKTLSTLKFHYKGKENSEAVVDH